MIEKINTILINNSVKRLIFICSLFLNVSIIIAQDSVVIVQKSWMNKLTEEDQQKMKLADQNLVLANNILNEADSLEKELILLKSSDDTTNQININLLNQDIIQKKYEAYKNIVQANNIKISIYTSSIDKEISKVDAPAEYFEKIGKLIKGANENLNEAAILKKDLVSENDTNIYIEKMISIIGLDNTAIQKFRGIATIIMIIEEDIVKVSKTDTIPGEPLIDETETEIEPEPESDIMISKDITETDSLPGVEDSTILAQVKPDSMISVTEDTVDVKIDTTTTSIDRDIETMQDSESNAAFEKNIATLLNLLNLKYSALEMAIGSKDTAKYLNVIVNEKVIETIKLAIEDYQEDSAFEKSVAILRNLLDEKYASYEMAIGSEDTALYVNVIVNEKVVETLKLAIENYEEDTVFDLFNITTFDIDLILNALENYVEEISPVIYSDFDIDDDIEDDDDLTLAITEANKDDSETKDDKDIDKTTVKEPRDQIISKSITAQLIFRVQIAADRVPLKENKLKLRYNGKREIKMFKEEGWYKYYIADCNTLKEAILIKKESKVTDAFIMAYKNGVKIPFYLKYVKHGKVKAFKETKDGFRDLVNLSKDKTTIVVQIIASRKPMKDEDIRVIYFGSEQINYIEEEGWHKYSIGNFAKFKAANSLRKTLEIKGAFVVAYKNGEKIDLWAKYKKK